MRVVIHIGLTKTGTSSFQRALDGERDTLARHDISFLGPIGLKGGAMRRFAHAVARNAQGPMAEAWAEIEPLTQQRGTVVLSSENLQSARAAGIETLKRFLDQRFERPGYTIYVGIRRWADRLVSLWQQNVRHCSPVELPAYAEIELRRAAHGHVLDIARRIDPWSAVFGQHSMLVIPMEEALEADGDVAAHAFKRLFGVRIAAQRYLANRSVISQTELIRAINLRHSAQSVAERRAIVRSVLHFWHRRKPVVLSAANLIESRLQQMSIPDDHPLFRQLEQRSGYAFPARPPATWRYAPNHTFAAADVAKLVAAIDRKATARAGRVLEGRRQARDQLASVPGFSFR